MELCLLLISIFPLLCPTGTAQSKSSDKKSGLPALVVDKSAPLLLDEADAQATGAKPAADNTACQVCHVNFADEPLAKWHSKAGVGCVQCHGNSYAHRNDENNITPPEKMYSSEKIDPACQHCHPQHNATPKTVVERWIQQGLEKKGLASLVCTDCHGNHRLALRTVRWDKNTGKLTSTNKK
jgi:hypothetical protein